MDVGYTDGIGVSVSVVAAIVGKIRCGIPLVGLGTGSFTCAVGMAKGAGKGATVGRDTGIFEGSGKGAADGLGAGSCDGAGVGMTVGSEVGSGVGSGIGFSDGSGVVGKGVPRVGE